jgi:hypothetical protein
MLCVCVSAAAQAQKDAPKFVAPSASTINYSIISGMGTPPTKEIWVDNYSSVHVVITALDIISCENVREPCGRSTVRVPIAPGGREMVRRLHAIGGSNELQFTVRLSYTADTAEMVRLRPEFLTNTSVLGDAAKHFGSEPPAPLPVVPGQPLLRPTDVMALNPVIARLKLMPDSVVMHVSESFVMGSLRVLALDAKGKVLGRVGFYQWRLAQDGVLTAEGDTIVAMKPGRTAVAVALVLPAAPRPISLPVVVLDDTPSKQDRR